MRNFVIDAIKESIQVKDTIIKVLVNDIVKASELIISSLKSSGKLIVFGNGGSAADSQHLVAELVGRFMMERKGLPAISLTTNTSLLTAISNDYIFDDVFARQLEALAGPRDVALAISTSGSSNNVIKAIEKAKQLKVKTIALTGKDGGELARVADISIIVPSQNTPRIQEAHITICHVICELVEQSYQSFG